MELIMNLLAHFGLNCTLDYRAPSNSLRNIRAGKLIDQVQTV